MLSKNNGSPEVCVNNLIKIARGEVPYDRVKGVDVLQIDAPASVSVEDATDDVEWLLGVYEPRAEVESVDVSTDEASEGHFTIKATINTVKEAEQ